MSTTAAIAMWIVLGTVGVVLLSVWCWWASTRAWRSDDVAPGVKMPDRHSLYVRKDRR